MRDLSKLMTGALVAGAALLVVACGSNEDAAANNAAMNIEEPLPTGNDMTNVDAMDGAGANIGAMDSTGNETTTDTTVNTTETTTNTSTTVTNGM